MYSTFRTLLDRRYDLIGFVFMSSELCGNKTEDYGRRDNWLLLWLHRVG